MRYGTEIVIVGLGAFLATLGAAFAVDDLFRAHMWVLFFVLAGSTAGIFIASNQTSHYDHGRPSRTVS